MTALHELVSPCSGRMHFFFFPSFFLVPAAATRAHPNAAASMGLPVRGSVRALCGGPIGGHSAAFVCVFVCIPPLFFCAASLPASTERLVCQWRRRLQPPLDPSSPPPLQRGPGQTRENRVEQHSPLHSLHRRVSGFCFVFVFAVFKSLLK